MPLGSFTWNGVTPVDGPWLGGVFAAPLALDGGTTYFLGMSGWEQSLADHGPSGGAGVNWIHPPDQDGAENLGAGSGYTGTGFSTQMNVGMMPATYCNGVGRKNAATGNRLSPLRTFTTASPATLFGAAVASTSASKGAERPPTAEIASKARSGSGVIPITG